MPIANSADDKAMYGCFAIVEIMKKTPASLFVCLLLVILASDCKHSTEPPVPPVPDTTSHAITWQIDRLGGASSSVLADVVIVNDTLAYAVGEMYIRDSTGAVDPIPYNLAEWNGARWTLKRLMFPIFNEHGAILGYGPDPGRSIFVVSPGDFWVASASALIHWTAEAKVPEPVTLNYQQGRINTIFGASGDL